MEITRRTTRIASLVCGLAMAALMLPAASSATVLGAWGSSLSATPTLDTANGASAETNDEPLSSYPRSNSADEGISTSYSAGCTKTYGATTLSCTPWMHDGADNTIWNTAVAGGSATAPQGGQVLDIRVKGCAVKDPKSPSQVSDTGTGSSVPVNTIEFQTLTPSGGSYKVGATAGPFTLPFCSDASSGANTISTYQPVHMCIAAGDTVSFYDLGGNVPNPSGGPAYYPQGVPFQVIAPTGGSGTDSFADADLAGGAYTPGAQPRGDNSGWGQEGGQEVELQVIEGTGDDAYGLCPGGKANEPAGSNTITCVYHSASTEGYPTCNAQGLPVYPPAASSPPTISGTAAVNQRLNESHGAWSNTPYGYKIQWERCNLSGANCSAISGATNGWYYPVAADVGSTLRVEEWATNDANTGGPAVSLPTAVVTSGSGGGSGGSGSGSGGSGSGGSGSGSGGTKPGAAQLAISLLRLNPASFFASKGTTVTYTDNRAAKTTLHVFRLVPGMRRGKACVAIPKHKHGHVAKCTRMVSVKTLVHQDKAGGNAVKLRGLSAGKYELEAIATMGSGRSSAIAHFNVKPKRH